MAKKYTLKKSLIFSFNGKKNISQLFAIINVFLAIANVLHYNM